MNETPALAKPERFVSLDVFRGITIAGMTLVNNPGAWDKDKVYAPLLHVPWNGWTPTDLVFPFFLFIVGIAIPLSFDKRLAAGHSRWRLFEQVAKRTIVIFLLGLFLNGFPDLRLVTPYVLMIAGLGFLFHDDPPLGWPASGVARFRKAAGWFLIAGAVAWFAADFRYFHASGIRVPGVLQRIAICYFIVSLIVMFLGVTGRAACAVILLLGYWAIYKFVPLAPDPGANVVSPDGLLHFRIDRWLLPGHTYALERPDPEGVLSTLPAVATALAGVLVGNWLRSPRDAREKACGLFVAGNVAVFLGMWMNYSIPINKKIWTSSYVLLMAGIAMNVLAMCYWLVDIRGVKRWATPFLVLGTNAIAVYVASGILNRILLKITAAAPNGPRISSRTWLFQTFYESWASPKSASLLFALSYVALALVVFLPLYRRRIFIKV